SLQLFTPPLSSCAPLLSTSVRKSPSLRVCSKRADLRILGHGIQTLPVGFDGRPVGRPETLDSAASARRPAAHHRPARRRECHRLPDPRRLRLARLAPRLPALEDRVQLLRGLEARRHLGPHPHPPAPAASPG